MSQAAVIIIGKDDKVALIDGAEQLGVAPDEVILQKINKDEYKVCLKNAPGEIDIFIRDDKMAAYIKSITPPTGDGDSLTVNDVTGAIAELDIVFGLNMEAVEKAVSEVNETGAPVSNILIAAGEPGEIGKDAVFEMKIGHDAVNKDEHARSIVRPGQVIAVRTPPMTGMPGHNIIGEELPPKEGKDIKIVSGENVHLEKDDTLFVSDIYGMAKSSWKDVSVTNLINLSEDKMRAEMPIVPVLADSSRLTLEDIITTLKQSGIVYGIADKIITRSIEDGEYIPGLTVAEGTPSRDGIDAHIEFRFKLNNDAPESVDILRRDKKIDSASVIKDLFEAGDVIAVKVPLKGPEAGRTIVGDLLKGDKPKDQKIKVGDNILLLDDGLTYAVAEGVTGYADIDGDKLFIEEILSISEDFLEASLTVHPPSQSGKMLQIGLVNDLLTDRGIVYGIDKGEIENAIDRVSKKGKPEKDITIARGKPAVKGEDASIKYYIGFEKGAGRIKGDNGQIDYRERDAIHNVKKGDIIAEKIPLAQGTKGMDILGRVLDPEKGADIKLFPVCNIGVSEDGLTFSSQIKGMVIRPDKEKIGVVNAHEIPGDVDLSTGNLRMDGALDIKGWVTSGFQVHARGEIHIGGGIEDALVESEGSLHVKGGIIGAKKTIVRSGGDLSVHFIENSYVHADGDIFIRDNIVRSRVSSGGNIFVTEGKGRIMGGSIEAVKGIDANEIGSETGIKTRVGVGLDLKTKKRIADVAKKQSEYKRSKVKMDMALARCLKKGNPKSLPRETAIKLSKVVKLRRQTILAENRLSSYMKELECKLFETCIESPEVTVGKIVHSGTSVSVRDKLFNVEEDINEKVIFRLNEAQCDIEVVR